MKFLPRIKQYLTRPRASVYRVYRSAISSGKRAWKNYIKRWALSILSVGKTVFELLCVILVVLAVVLAVVLFIAIFWRVFDWQGADWIDGWLGTSDLATAIKWETIKTLSQALLGLGLIVGIYVAYRRALASEETSKAQHNANEQKMFNEATAKLGDKSASVRLGGIYALDKLASSNEAYLTRIVEILCAHLRETAQQGNDEEENKKKDRKEGKKENKEEDEKIDKKKYAEKYKDKPSNEIQSLLEVLSGLNQLGEEKQEDRQSKPVRLNLSGAYLVGANLEDACLNRADLSSTDIRKAHLSRAQLQKANLQNAKMQRARLGKAQLQGASLWGAQMREARLVEAQMQMASLDHAQMQGAYLWGAQMQGARLGWAQMQRAYLWGAQMQMVSLDHAQMQGAILYGAQMQGAELREAQMQGAGLHQARMQGAILYQTQLQGAELREAQMQGADLHQADMQGAILDRTQMQGTDIGLVQMQGAKLNEVDLRGAYVSSSVEHLNLPGRIKKRRDKQTDLTTVIFKGGLRHEDARRIREQLTRYQKDGWMTKEEVTKINVILEEHQDKPINGEEPSGIKTGSYDKKEADAIIAEYEKAMAYLKKTDPLTD